MSKVLKAVAILGNVSEVIIASSLVVEMISKIRGNKKNATPTTAEEVPQPETPIAA